MECSAPFFMSIDLFLFSQINYFTLDYFWLDVIVIFLANYLPYIVIGVLFLFLLKNCNKYLTVITKGLASAGLATFFV